MRYEGKVYRPWIEASSLLIQATLGCTNNKCTFCNMFRDKKFKIKNLDDIFEDIEEARKVYSHVESVFLIDGNVMVLKTEMILKILNKIREVFPEVIKISLYSELNDLRRKSVDDLKKLKKAGLSTAYVGLESGDSITLEKIKKGMTVEQAIEGMKNAKDAEIDVLASFIFGLGGKYRSKEHIEETVKLLNIVQPEEIAPMALAIQPGTELEKEVLNGDFEMPSPLQVLEEELYLLENLDEFKMYYWGDHGNNIVPMRGWLPKHKDVFIKQIKKTIANDSITKEEKLQTFAW